jgi:Gram-negative bacterial TonB protein C-terminal
MKRLITIVFAALSISALAADTSVQGYLIDSSCAARSARRPGFGAGHARTCLRMPSCAASGYGVLTDDKRFIKFDQDGSEQAKQLLADLTQEANIKVNVSGKVDGDRMTVTGMRLVVEEQKPVTQSAAPQEPEPPPKTLPFIVKGAWASASDSMTPLPESGSIAGNVYTNRYFGLSYPLSSDWYEKIKGPPPSDGGYYVLAQLRPSEAFKGPAKGIVLITAYDLFFSPIPSRNAMELVNYTKDTLRPEYKVEQLPAEIKIAKHSFARFDYVAPAIDLHWRILATQIRCHTVQLTLASTDTKLLDSLIHEMDAMTLPAEAGVASGTGGGDFPVCIKDYASGDNVITKVDPVFAGRRFNPVPVRIIIGKDGKVKHIHCISAFPDQAKAVTDALTQWTFKPYLPNGQPVEVETGIMFGTLLRKPGPAASAATPAGPANQ